MSSAGVAGIPEFQGIQAPPGTSAPATPVTRAQPASTSPRSGVPRKGGSSALSPRKPIVEVSGLPDFGFSSDTVSQGKPKTQPKTTPRDPESCLAHSLPPCSPASSIPHLTEKVGALLHAAWESHGKEVAHGMAEWPIVIHMILASVLTWICGRLHINVVLVVLLATVFMYQVHTVYAQRLKGQQRKEVRNQMLLESPVSDEETTRWLNTVLSRAWPIWLERTMALHLIPQMAPWFLNTYKPWALKRLELRSACLGCDPPIVTGVRVYTMASDGYHVEMEMNVELVAAPDMFLEFVAHVGSAKWAGLGLIPWTAFATHLHLYGRVRVGLRFRKTFPFVDRISISFISEPHVSQAINVMGMGLGKGFDAGALPLVASYVDATLKKALKGSLVAPNKLVIEDIAELLAEVVDSAKHPHKSVTPGVAAAGAHPPHSNNPVASPMHSSPPLAYARVELLEAEQLMAKDSNGFSDPFIKGSIGPAKFNTSIKRKTLNPKWFEDFRVPILEWQQKTVLALRLMDYDRYTADDDLGMCEIDLCLLRDGRRHDMWIRLHAAKSGKVHVAITIQEEEEGDRVHKAEHEAQIHDGSAAVITTQTVTKEGGHVAMAAATLYPKEEIGQQSAPEEQAAPVVASKGTNQETISDVNKLGKEELSRRAVHMGTSSYKIAPGCVIYAWDQ